MTLFGKQPAVLIGIGAAVVVAVIQVLAGNGIITDVTAGKIADTTSAVASLLQIVVPIVAGYLIHQQVTPTANPALPVGTPVNGGTATVTVTGEQLPPTPAP